MTSHATPSFRFSPEDPLPSSDPASERAFAPAGQCPLCGEGGAVVYHADPEREFRLCRGCTLVFVPPSYHLSPEAERHRYAQHENDGADPRYVQFLERLANPLAERLRNGARGLDFGAGPGPVLASLMTERGFPSVSYDPFFSPDASRLEERYDFITCSEVVEHLHEPGSVFGRLRRMLRPEGMLGVMTRFYGDEPFGDWWYRRDPTHVCFYREETMRWIAETYRWTVDFPAANVALFTAVDAR